MSKNTAADTASTKTPRRPRSPSNTDAPSIPSAQHKMVDDALARCGLTQFPAPLVAELYRAVAAEQRRNLTKAVADTVGSDWAKLTRLV